LRAWMARGGGLETQIYASTCVNEVQGLRKGFIQKARMREAGTVSALSLSSESHCFGLMKSAAPWFSGHAIFQRARHTLPHWARVYCYRRKFIILHHTSRLASPAAESVEGFEKHITPIDRLRGTEMRVQARARCKRHHLACEARELAGYECTLHIMFQTNPRTRKLGVFCEHTHTRIAQI
jgi:hypothetical protein